MDCRVGRGRHQPLPLSELIGQVSLQSARASNKLLRCRNLSGTRLAAIPRDRISAVVPQ